MKGPTRRGEGEWGCLATILTAMVFIALIFGVTVNGRHYEISCGTGGVTVESR